MIEINQDDVIMDIRRIAINLNRNKLTEQEYVENDGQYSLSIFEDYEDKIGSFANNVVLAGFKYRV